MANESTVEAKEFEAPLEVSSHFDLGDCWEIPFSGILGLKKSIYRDSNDAFSCAGPSKERESVVEPIRYIKLVLL